MKTEIIDLNPSNVDAYDLFCKKSQKFSEGYRKKLAWVKSQFGLGLRIKLVVEYDAKGPSSKGFIEYMPGEVCWRSVNAPGWLVIHCLWVTGQNKGKGYGSRLLDECINDAKSGGFKGVAVLTSENATFLVKKKLFMKTGFSLAESIEVSNKTYDLFYHPVKKIGEKDIPVIAKNVKSSIDDTDGFHVFDSCQCPYAADSNETIKNYAKSQKEKCIVKDVTNLEGNNKSIMGPFGAYAVFYHGKRLTHRPLDLRTLKKITE
jgi:GNAT superfamily N-acetyltransferase